MKLSSSKGTLPGAKQVFRLLRDGVAVGDRIGRRDEAAGPGETPLLEPVMEGGRRTAAGRVTLEAARAHARSARETLPPTVRSLDAPPHAYPVAVSERLAADRDALAEELRHP
jgi:nicotinate phosphoribosyltransferase